MRKRITYISPHKTAITLSLVLALSSLLFVVPMLVFSSFIPATDHQGNPINTGFPIFMFIAMPVFYLIFGYLFTALSAWIYNHVAKLTGGIIIDMSEENR